MPFVQRGLRVKCVHLRRAAVQENVDDAFGLRREVPGLARGEGIRAGDFRGCRCARRSEDAPLAEQPAEGEHAHAHARATHEIATGEKEMLGIWNVMAHRMS